MQKSAFEKIRETPIQGSNMLLETKDEYWQQELEISPLVSIIIPVYNEEKTILEIVERIPNHFRYEIIIVDDGSTDKSVQIIEKIKNHDLKLINHEKNKGYGAAILSGLDESEGDIIVTMDSDGQHNPEEIYTLIRPILEDQADLVIGSRYLGKSAYKVPLHTRVGEIFIGICLWSLFQKKVRNNQSGYRAFSRKHLGLFKNVIYEKFGYCTEIVFKAAYKNLRLCEVPITINKRKYGTSYIKIPRIIKSILSCIFVYSMKKLGISSIFPRRIGRIFDHIYVIITRYLSRVL